MSKYGVKGVVENCRNLGEVILQPDNLGGSAFLAALKAIFVKIGVKDMDADLATAISTLVILFITWGSSGDWQIGRGSYSRFFITLVVTIIK